MTLPWDDVAYFLAVAEAGSFSSAARRLRVGQATVSRRIAQLEALVGAPLFRRGVDGVTLTAAADRLLPAARRMAESAGELTRLVAAGESQPTGRVRIAAPPGIAVDLLAPFARHVRKVHPALRLEVLSGIGYVDLVRHDADLALRARKPTEDALTWIGELQVPAVAMATKALIRRLPANPTVKDVDWITWAPPYENLPPRPQLERLIPGFEPVFTSDSYLVQWAAAEAGIGAMFMDPRRHRFARRSPLTPLPMKFDYVGRTYLVAAKTMLIVPRVRAVVDLLVEEFEKAEGFGFVLNEGL